MADPPYKDRPRRRRSDLRDVGRDLVFAAAITYFALRSASVGVPWPAVLFLTVLALSSLLVAMGTLESYYRWRTWDKFKREFEKRFGDLPDD